MHILSLTLKRLPKKANPVRSFLSVPLSCLSHSLNQDSAQCRSKIIEDFPDFSMCVRVCVCFSVCVCVMLLETKTPAVGSPVGKACGRKMWARWWVIMSAWEIRRVILHNHTSKKTEGGWRRRQHVICLLWYNLPSKGLEACECALVCVYVSVCVCMFVCLYVLHVSRWNFVSGIFRNYLLISYT